MSDENASDVCLSPKSQPETRESALPKPTLTAEQLRNGLQHLPQELYDLVYNLIFACEDSSIVVLEARRKPPVQLRINREIRKNFLQSYYHDATWVVTGGWQAYGNYKRITVKLVQSWLSSLPDDAANMFASKKYNRPVWTDDFWVGEGSNKHFMVDYAISERAREMARDFIEVSNITRY